MTHEKTAQRQVAHAGPYVVELSSLFADVPVITMATAVGLYFGLVMAHGADEAEPSFVDVFTRARELGKQIERAGIAS